MENLLQSLTARPEPWTVTEIVLNCTVAFLLGLLITWVYRSSHRHQTPSATFVITLVLLSMIMSAVMMVIGNNIARAFGLAGAMSIIRFRTVVKDTRDTAFVFFALMAGMAAGTGNLKISVVATLLISLFIGILHWTRHGVVVQDQHSLSFERVPTDVEAERNVHVPVFERFLSTYQLVDVRSLRMGELLRMTYRVQLKDPGELQELVTELSVLEGLQRVSCGFGEDLEVGP